MLRCALGATRLTARYRAPCTASVCRCARPRDCRSTEIQSFGLEYGECQRLVLIVDTGADGFETKPWGKRTADFEQGGAAFHLYVFTEIGAVYLYVGFHGIYNNSKCVLKMCFSLFYQSETHAVVLAGAGGGNGRAMVGGRVSLVFKPVILRKVSCRAVIIWSRVVLARIEAAAIFANFASPLQRFGQECPQKA